MIYKRKIAVPKRYKKTNGMASRPDRYLKIKMPKADVDFMRSHMLLDHAETFNMPDGEWFIVAHVYPSYMNVDNMDELDAICKRSNLCYEVFDDSWYSDDVKRIEYYNSNIHGR